MDFKILANWEGKKKFSLKKEKIYVMPAGATHIRVYAGELCFGVSWDGNVGKTKRGKFFKIPGMLPGGIRVNAVNFPAYCRNESGDHYGEPKFFGPPITPARIIP